MWLTQVLPDRVATSPDAVVLVDDDGTPTWAEFAERVRARQTFRVTVTERLDRVAYLSSARKEHFELLFACAGSGRTFVPMNPVTASEKLVALLDSLIRDVQGTADGTAPDGLIRLLVDAERSGTLTRDDLIATLSAVVTAGVETTVGLLTNATVAFLRQPGLAAGPLDERAVTELVRVATPIVIDRWVHGGGTVDGVALPDRAHVVLLLGAANRDPRAFPDPDVVDPARAVPALGFGGGVHHCLGAPPARLHVQIAVPELISAFPELVADGEPLLGPHLNPSAYLSLPVRF